MPTPNEAKEEKARIWNELAGEDGQVVQPAQSAKEEPPAKEGTESAPETKPAAEQAADNTDADAKPDPYEGVPQFVRDEIAGLKSLYAQTQTQLRDTRGHIGGLTSRLKELSQAAKEAKASGGDAPTAEQLRSAQGSAGAMARLKGEYPEFGAAMDAALEERLAPLKDRFERAKTEPAETTSFVTREEMRSLQVEAVHRGWEDKVATPEFRGWLSTQPREVQLLAESESPRDAIRLLDLHVEARSHGTNDKQAQRLSSAAAIPTGRASNGVRVKPLDQMTKAEYWAYLNEQERATKA